MRTSAQPPAADPCLEALVLLPTHRPANLSSRVQHQPCVPQRSVWPRAARRSVSTSGLHRSCAHATSRPAGLSIGRVSTEGVDEVPLLGRSLLPLSPQLSASTATSSDLLGKMKLSCSVRGMLLSVSCLAAWWRNRRWPEIPDWT